MLEMSSPFTPVPEPAWKQAARMAYTVFFLAVILAAALYFWQFESAFRKGASQPTAAQTEAISNHGQVVFISPDEWGRIALLRRVWSVGAIIAVVAGLTLQFGLKVSLTPPLSLPPELLDRSGNQTGERDE